MLRQIVKIANKLDSLGLTKEADVLDRYIQKMAFDVLDSFDALPDSPEELAAYKAQKPELMMGSPSSPSSRPGTGIRGVAPAPAPAGSSAPKPQVNVPAATPSGHSSTELAEDKERKAMYNAFLKSRGYRKPDEVASQFGFNFTLTGGKGGTIAKIQSALNSCGFPAGAADGFWGKNTENAFLDALHAFLLLSPHPAAMEKLSDVGANIMDGEPPGLPFTYEMVISMCDRIKQARAEGIRISLGRQMGENYAGSMGGGRYEQENSFAPATLVSTRAGEPAAGTAR